MVASPGARQKARRRVLDRLQTPVQVRETVKQRIRVVMAAQSVTRGCLFVELINEISLCVCLLSDGFCRYRRHAMVRLINTVDSPIFGVCRSFEMSLFVVL